VLVDSVSADGRVATAVAVPMAIWWLIEAIPLLRTVLLPVVLSVLGLVTELGRVQREAAITRLDDLGNTVVVLVVFAAHTLGGWVRNIQL